MRVWQLSARRGGAKSGHRDDWDGQGVQDDGAGGRARQHGGQKGVCACPKWSAVGDEVNCETSVWAISACPAKNRKK